MARSQWQKRNGANKIKKGNKKREQKRAIYNFEMKENNINEEEKQVIQNNRIKIHIC